MVGPYGDWVKYSLEEPVQLVTECDGVFFLLLCKSLGLLSTPVPEPRISHQPCTLVQVGWKAGSDSDTWYW